MDTPTHFFSDCMDLEGGSPYPGNFDREDRPDRGAQQSFTPNPDTRIAGATPIKTENAWDHTQETFKGDTDQKPIFAESGPYPQLDDGVSPNDPDKPSSSTTETRSSMTDSRASKASSASSPPPPALPSTTPPPTKRRKTRREKKGAGIAEEDEKRSKFLERNRIAASKCRQKKKEYVSELEETKVGLENQHSHLTMELNELLEEATRLKNHLMLHANCNDRNIDKWLANEARRFVQSTTGGRPRQLFPATPQPEDSRHLGISSNYRGFPYLGMDMGLGREGIAYSHPPSLQTSPTDVVFPRITSSQVKRDTGINYDHMPDSMFSPRSQIFGDG